MTKDEAIEICKRITNRDISEGETFVEVLSALGILKVEEPKTATERALNAMNALFLDRFSEVKSEEFCEALKEASVRIVDR